MRLILIKLLASINNGRLESLFVTHKLYNIKQAVHTIDFEVIDHGRLTGVLHWHNQSLEVLCPGSNGNRQCSLDGLQRAVQTQLAYQHKFLEVRVGDVLVGSQDADGKGQVETAAFLAEVGRSKIDGDVGDRKLETAVLQGCGNAVTTLSYSLVAKTCKMILDSTCEAHLHGNRSHVQSVDCGAKSFD